MSHLSKQLVWNRSRVLLLSAALLLLPAPAATTLLHVLAQAMPSQFGTLVAAAAAARLEAPVAPARRTADEEADALRAASVLADHEDAPRLDPLAPVGVSFSAPAAFNVAAKQRDAAALSRLRFPRFAHAALPSGRAARLLVPRGPPVV